MFDSVAGQNSQIIFGRRFQIILHQNSIETCQHDVVIVVVVVVNDVNGVMMMRMLKVTMIMIIIVTT